MHAEGPLQGKDNHTEKSRIQREKQHHPSFGRDIEQRKLTRFGESVDF